MVNYDNVIDSLIERINCFCSSKKTIIVFYPDYYTKEHNQAIKWLVHNLRGVTVLQDAETASLINVTKEAYNVIERLNVADCLYFEEG